MLTGPEFVAKSTLVGKEKDFLCSKGLICNTVHVRERRSVTKFRVACSVHRYGQLSPSHVIDAFYSSACDWTD